MNIIYSYNIYTVANYNQQGEIVLLVCGEEIVTGLVWVNTWNIIKVLLLTDAQENCFKSIKIYIKTAPTYFSVITIIREHTVRAC